MILETFLAFSLHFNAGNYLPAFDLLATPSYARSYTPRTSFRSTTTFRTTASPSFRSNNTYTAPKTFQAPKPVQATTPKPSAPSVVRISKQVTPQTKNIIETPRSGSTTRPVIAAPTNRPVITRERYVERYNDSGVMGNPWFWMYMFENNRQQAPQIQQPTQIVVRDSDNKSVSVPESQMIVRRYSWSPIREFFVFFLGLGGGVFVRHKLIR